MNMRSLHRLKPFALGIVVALIVAACSSPAEPTLYTVSVTVGGTGAGSVSSTPAGIDTTVADGSQADFEDGTLVTLTASAAAGSTFAGWGGACGAFAGTTCDVTVDAAKSVSATFDEVLGTLDLTVTGLPGSLVPSIRVTGPGGYDETFTSDIAVSLPPGSYTVTPGPVADMPAIYRASERPVSVVADATASVSIVYERPSVLYFENSPSAYIPAALEANGFEVNDVTAPDLISVTNELTAGGYDLAVVLFPNDSSEPAFVTALEGFVTDGGHVVFAEYSPTADIATLFDASYSGTSNLTTADLDPPLDAGITDPVTLDGAGYGTYSNGLTVEDGGTSLCTFENDDSCFVLGNDGRTALLGFLGDTIPEADGQTFWENLSLFMLE